MDSAQVERKDSSFKRHTAEWSHGNGEIQVRSISSDGHVVVRRIRAKHKTHLRHRKETRKCLKGTLKNCAVLQHCQIKNREVWPARNCQRTSSQLILSGNTADFLMQRICWISIILRTICFEAEAQLTKSMSRS